jgi:hypothetical protein
MERNNQQGTMSKLLVDGASAALAAADTEQSVLQMLQRIDFEPALFEKLAKSDWLTKSRKVTLAMVRHPQAPRHIVLSLLRSLFTFDLMRVALTPAISADLKIAAEEGLIQRLEKLSVGEKLSLARRSSGRVAGALLNEAESRIVDVALENGRLTEAAVVKALMKRNASSHLIESVSAHPKWGLRGEVREALTQREVEITGVQPE